jgi:hypothetical protein
MIEALDEELAVLQVLTDDGQEDNRLGHTRVSTSDPAGHQSHTAVVCRLLLIAVSRRGGDEDAVAASGDAPLQSCLLDS